MQKLNLNGKRVNGVKLEEIVRDLANEGDFSSRDFDLSFPSYPTVYSNKRKSYTR